MEVCGGEGFGDGFGCLGQLEGRWIVGIFLESVSISFFGKSFGVGAQFQLRHSICFG